MFLEESGIYTDLSQIGFLEKPVLILKLITKINLLRYP